MLGGDCSVHRLLAPGALLPACDARIAELYRYWLSRRPSADALPGRRHISPIDIPRLLPWLWIAEVHRAPLRFKYRLIGTAHVDVFGKDPTGRWYDEVHPNFPQSTAYPLFVAAAERGLAAFYRGSPAYVIDAAWKRIERLILPLAQNGSGVDMLLGITVLDLQPPLPLGG